MSSYKIAAGPKFIEVMRKYLQLLTFSTSITLQPRESHGNSGFAV